MAHSILTFFFFLGGQGGCCHVKSLRRHSWTWSLQHAKMSRRKSSASYPAASSLQKSPPRQLSCQPLFQSSASRMLEKLAQKGRSDRLRLSTSCLRTNLSFGLVDPCLARKRSSGASSCHHPESLVSTSSSETRTGMMVMGRMGEDVGCTGIGVFVGFPKEVGVSKDVVDDKVELFGFCGLL